MSDTSDQLGVPVASHAWLVRSCGGRQAPDGGTGHQLGDLCAKPPSQYCTTGTMCNCRDVHAFTTHDVVLVLFRELNIA